MKVLITAGATREPIDEVRFLSNVSTGATGAALAENFARRGHAVTLLRGVGAVSPAAIDAVETFSSAEDLRGRLQRRLASGLFDLVVMAAAVSDYRPREKESGKISSDQEELVLRLVRTAKILPQLKSYSPRPVRVIGFKLTVGASPSARAAAVAAQFTAGGVDAVVQNDLVEMRSAEVHPFWLYPSAGCTPEAVNGAAALAEALLRDQTS